MSGLNPSLSSKSIFLIGPSSTGKSTLSLSLLPHLPSYSLISETARRVMIARGYTRLDVSMFPMQRDIFFAQLEEERERMERLQGLVADRCCLDAVAYCRKEGVEEEKQLVEVLKGEGEEGVVKNYRKGVVVLCLPVEEFRIDDGVRAISNEIEDSWEFVKVYEDLLNEFGIRYHTLGEKESNLDKRVELVLKWLNED